MKAYTKPSIKQKGIEAEEIMAASASTVSNTYSDGQQLSRRHTVWDDEQEEEEQVGW